MKPAEFGALLSEEPRDAAGIDFRNRMGLLAASLKATPNNLTELSFQIFESRLAFSREFHTPFAKMVEGTYEDRWDGVGEYAWSFGFRDELRGKEIISIFERNLEPKVDTWAFYYKQWTFLVYRAVGNYYICHAHASEVPAIRRELERLWQASFMSISDLFRFEWLWYRANPFGRAGASTGAVLSILLQKCLSYPYPKRYEKYDLEALSLPVEEYIRRRM
jgi:hypothetical protein